MESIGVVVMKNKLSLENIEKIKSPRNGFFLQKIMKKNVKLCQKFWKQRLQTWINTHAQKFRVWFSKMKNMIWGIANSPFMMQKLFIVQKEKHLHTEHELDVFITNCKL